MKTFLRNILLKLKIYHRLKYSFIFRAYEHLFKPEVILQHKKEVNLYESFLGHCDLIFDIGAYDGHKTAAFAEISEKVICCEPDPDNFRLLQIRFRNNKKKIVPLNYAVFNTTGEAILQRNYAGSAFNTLKKEWRDVLEKDRLERWNEKIEFADHIAVKVETTTLDELIRKYGKPDFIKLDVEGSELEAVQGLSHKIKSISFECLLPEFMETCIRILDILIQLNSSFEFNVIFNEEILLKNNISHKRMIDWIRSTDLHSFDLLVISIDSNPL